MASLEGRSAVERVLNTPCAFQNGSKVEFGRLSKIQGLEYRVLTSEGRTLTLRHNAVFSATEDELVNTGGETPENSAAPAIPKTKKKVQTPPGVEAPPSISIPTIPVPPVLATSE